MEDVVLTKKLPLIRLLKKIIILSNYDSVAEAEFKIISSEMFYLIVSFVSSSLPVREHGKYCGIQRRW